MEQAVNDDMLNPFDRFLKNPELDMLNAALPYVSGRMRTPLALYIKITEMNRIVSDFDREDILSACGFEQNTPDPEMMLKAMKMAGGNQSNPQIDQLLSMMNMLKTYQKLHEMIQNNPELLNLLSNMMNQAPNGGNTKQNNTESCNSSQSTNLSPADMLKQLSGGDTSDMMSLLTQMLKNSR